MSALKRGQLIVSPKGREYRVVAVEPPLAYGVVRNRAWREIHTQSEPPVTGVAHWLRDDLDGVAIRTAKYCWLRGLAYVDSRGNYHERREGRCSGPVAWWNQIAKRWYSSCEELHKATLREVA